MPAKPDFFILIWMVKPGGPVEAKENRLAKEPVGFVVVLLCMDGVNGVASSLFDIGVEPSVRPAAPVLCRGQKHKRPGKPWVSRGSQRYAFHRRSAFYFSKKSRRYWEGVMPSAFLNTLVNTR